MRAGLAFRAAVDVHGDGALAGEARRWAVQESGKHAPVETLPANQFRFGKVRHVQTARLAVSPALDGARGDVQRVYVGRRAHRFDGQAEVGAVGMPLEPTKDTKGELRDRPLLAGRRLE